MITPQLLRQKLQQHLPVIGTWLQLPSPDVAEIIGAFGYDFVAVDMEHGGFSRSTLPNMFRAITLHGSLPFARLEEASMSHIKAALDCGAKGLIFPMVESRQQLDRAINWTFYPNGHEHQEGTRGVGFARANLWGMNFAEHTNPTGVSFDTVVVAQIEHKNALENLDAIFAHPRLDAYMVGPYDLSASMGITGEFTHPQFIEALAHIEEKATAHKIPKGYHVVQPDPTALKEKIDQGYTFIAYGIDALFLQHGKRPL